MCTWRRDNLNTALIAFNWPFLMPTHALGFNPVYYGTRMPGQKVQMSNESEIC